MEGLDLRTRIGKVEIDGFIGNAPGPLKDKESWLKVANSSAAFVWCGSLGREMREGNEGNVFWTDEAPARALNSLGLPYKDPGEYLDDLAEVQETGKHVVVDVAGWDEEDFPWLAEFFWRPGRSLCLNITCPNIVGKRVFAYDLEVTDRTIASTREAVPDANLIVTLNPHPDTWYHEQMAEILDRRGVDAIRLCNTWPGAMSRDRKTLKPVITPNKGLAGLSGEDIRTMVSGQIVRYRQLLPGIGVIASGGLSQGWHAVHYAADGADAAASATTYAIKGVDSLVRMQAEMIDEMTQLGVNSVPQIRQSAG